MCLLLKILGFNKIYRMQIHKHVYIMCTYIYIYIYIYLPIYISSLSLL